MVKIKWEIRRGLYYNGEKRDFFCILKPRLFIAPAEDIKIIAYNKYQIIVKYQKDFYRYHVNQKGMDFLLFFDQLMETEKHNVFKNSKTEYKLWGVHIISDGKLHSHMGFPSADSEEIILKKNKNIIVTNSGDRYNQHFTITDKTGREDTYSTGEINVTSIEMFDKYATIHTTNGKVTLKPADLYFNKYDGICFIEYFIPCASHCNHIHRFILLWLKNILPIDIIYKILSYQRNPQFY